MGALGPTDGAKSQLTVAYLLLAIGVAVRLRVYCTPKYSDLQVSRTVHPSLPLALLLLSKQRPIDLDSVNANERDA